MENIEQKKYWVWYSLIPNIGNKKKRDLLKIYGDPEAVFNIDRGELGKIFGIGEKTIERILNKSIRNNVEKHINYMVKNNIDIISIDDENYPSRLKQIYDFPISLYYIGNKKILNQKNIAIIGCREATEYGKSCAKYFSYNLASKNINITSGLARGVDSYAHIGTVCAQLEHNSKTDEQCGKGIAILGNGLDMIYPKENEKLAKRIVDNGGIILSEYPLGSKPEKKHFPARNRIISGISDGIIVVEAKEKSGTMITVDFALEQGREIYVVPGNINSENSVGTNCLIKQGAKLVTNYEEIYSEIF